MIMVCVEMLVIAWFRWPASEFDWIDVREIGSDGSDGLECKSCGCFAVVKYIWLPLFHMLKPVFEMVDIRALDTHIKVIRVGGKE
jgi:hypothetical protein